MNADDAEDERHYLRLSLYGEEFLQQRALVFRSLMAAEGITSNTARAGEILDALPSFDEWLDPLVEPRQAKRL